MTQPQQLPAGAVDVTEDLLATIGELYFQLRMFRKAQQAKPEENVRSNGQTSAFNNSHAVPLDS